MLCRRKIDLHQPRPSPHENLILRETLADCTQAHQILTQARAQTQSLIRQAQIKCESLQEQATLDIWLRADALFQRWASERQAMCDSLERYASEIARQAIRTLLDEAVDSTRLAALLRQLLQSQVPEISSTLLCHPADVETIRHCLANQQSTHWKLHPDDNTPPQTLILQTDEGDFRISWQCLLDAFSAADHEHCVL